MSWVIVTNRFRTLADACRSGAPIGEAWSSFKAAVADTLNAPPVHLRTVLSELQNLEQRMPRDFVTILDHGTGTGINLFYLAAMGYRQIWGANVVEKAQSFNRVFREVLGYDEGRIFLYDGRRLPLADGSVDLVISQTVVEHLADDCLASYYAEEGRVLRPGGRAIHQVPHRLMPYDSHTCTWFIHYVPRRVQIPLYEAFSKQPEQVGRFLFLRWPWVHTRLACRHIGPTSDRTAERLRVPADIDSFDGPRSLRRMMDLAFNMPGLGPLFRILVSPFMMMESVSIRRADG